MLLSYHIWCINCSLAMRDSARVVAVNPVEKISIFPELLQRSVSVGRNEGDSEQKARRSVVAEMPSQV